MQVSPAADINTTLATQNATSRGFNDLKSEDFLALMIQELQSQDPLNPQDTGQLLQQLSNIRQIEQSATSSKTLQTLAQSLQGLSSTRFGDPNSLIGNYIAGTVTDPAGQTSEVQGVVVGVRFENSGEAIFELHNGSFIPAGGVEQVTLVENLPPEILQQLQDELGIPPAGDTTPPAPDGTDTTGNLAALLKNADPAGIKLPSSTQPDVAKQREQIVAQLLDSIFSVGAGVEVGL